MSLDSRLDEDLGLDSLTRVELLARVESSFALRLPDRVIAEAETPRDLLRALHAASGVRASPQDAVPRARPVRASAGSAAPQDTATLIDALEWHVREHPDRVHVHLCDEQDRSVAVTYGTLFERASLLAGGLVARGLSPGDSVAIMLPTGVEYLHSFLAILLAGATPVPIYPPARAKQIEEHFQRHARILSNARTRMLITFDDVKRVSRLLTARVAGLDQLVTPADLATQGAMTARPRIAPEQVAFLQYTSGSTGNPKGVVLTHANILASLRSMRVALDVGPDDVFVSWLPLYHDMGLIGAWLGSLVVGSPLVLMSPLAFLARPERWLQAIHRFGGTISGGPNFAYELCHRRIADGSMQGVDLSSWRLAFNGAEPVSADTIERFCGRFERWGLRATAMTPVYGLAEATLGVAFTPPGRGARIDSVSRSALYRDGVARPMQGDGTLRLVSSGVPIPDFEVRVVDQAGREPSERVEGEVEFRGPGVTGGYHRNSDATRALFHDGWVRSGDRGYMAGGELYITGRDKDVVIRAGRNLHPHALEQAVGEVAGVRRGCVAVFGGLDAVNGTERLVVLAETREQDPAAREAMRARIEALSLEHLELAPDEVVLAPPQSVLKTSSGKIRRAALADLHARGVLAQRVQAPWVQVLRLAAGSLLPTLRRSVRSASGALYAGWFALMLGVTVAWCWPAVLMLRGRERRWRCAHLAARAFLALAGIRVLVSGTAPGAADAGVIVTNHQSFLDGVVLSAVLEWPVSFVAKRELTRSAFARLFLDALDVRYVERFARERSVEDSRRVIDALSAAGRLLYFPEGTFHRMSGLLPFQLGAFEAAVAGAVPVFPIALSGTRHVLRGDEFYPRRHPVQVRFLDAMAAPRVDEEQSRWSAAVALRAAVRERMLQVIAEPDLVTRNVLAEMAARRRE
jgi:1-acyl-sn-glycerol-3-phosphate acyltransferase